MNSGLILKTFTHGASKETYSNLRFSREDGGPGPLSPFWIRPCLPKIQTPERVNDKAC